MPRQIILASGSPRRKELLEKMGVTFTAIPSDFDEYLDFNRPAAEVAIELGLGKARTVAEKHPEALVIGGDTIVTINGKQLAKPHDIEEARATLKDHADGQALVSSSVVLICKELNLELTGCDEVNVQFKPYDEAVNELYLASGDWADKAGGWGIQSGAAPLVAWMKGRYDTTLGMPTHILAKWLQEQGIDAHSVELTPPVPQK